MSEVDKEMITTIELTCEESQILLVVMDDDRDGNTFKEKEEAAVKHFLACPDCNDKGITAITGKEMSCQEALELAVNNKHKKLLFTGANTLRELRANQHFWGLGSSGETDAWLEEDRRCLHWNGGGDVPVHPNKDIFFKHTCNEPACKKFRDHILNLCENMVHMIGYTLGVTFKEGCLDETHVLFAIPLFVEHGWPVSKLISEYYIRESNEGFYDRTIYEEYPGFSYREVTSLVDTFRDRLLDRTFNSERAFEETTELQWKRIRSLQNWSGEK